MGFTKSEFWLSVYMGVAFSLLFTFFAGWSIVLFVAYFMAMFLWTLLSYFIVKILGKIDFYIKRKIWGQIYMNNFASLEKTMPPIAFEVPDGFLIHQLTEDFYVVAREDITVGMESIQEEPTNADLDCMADRAAKRQREIEESLNPAMAMFWTEFE